MRPSGRIISLLFGADGAERRIGLVAATVLTIVALVSALAVLGVFSSHVNRELMNGLERTLNDRAATLVQELQRADESAADIVRNRPRLHKLLNLIDGGMAKREEMDEIGVILDNIIQTGRYSGVRLFDAHGGLLGSRGQFAPLSPVSGNLGSPHLATVLWANGLVLHFRLEFRDGGQHRGVAEVQIPLRESTRMLADSAWLGMTGETLLCLAEGAERMKCFPSRHRPGGQIIDRSMKGIPLPVSHALSGKSGILTTMDYRDQQVVAAFKPVAGMGLLVKTDVTELRRPLLRQLYWLVPLLVLLVAFGIVLLRWRLGPLVHEVTNSRARVRAVLDNAAEGVITIDEKGMIESVNNATARLFGYACHELVGKNVSLLMPEPYRSEHDSYIRRHLETGESRIIGRGPNEAVGLHKNGTILPIELAVSEITLDDRRLFIGLVRDISERKQAEQALRDSEQAQRRQAEQQTAILEALPANIALLDQAGNIIAANQSWRNFSQENACSGDDYIGHNYLTVCDEASGDNAQEARRTAESIRAILAGKMAGFTIEYPCHSPSVKRWFRMVAVPLSRDRKDGAVVMHLDISAQKQAEMKLSRFASILESTTDFVGITDPDGRVLYVNQALRRATGMDEDERCEQAHFSRFHPQWAVDMLAKQGLPTAREKRSWQAETALLAADGHEIPVIQLILAHYNGDGLEYFSTLMHDISQRKLNEEALNRGHEELVQAYRKLEDAQAQLLQSEKMASIGQLAAGVAHEINNPIGYVYSNLGTMEKYLASLFDALDSYERLAAEQCTDGASASALNQVKQTLDLEYLREDIPALMTESREGIVRVKKIVQDLKDFSHADNSEEWKMASLPAGLDSTLNIVWNELKYKAEVIKEYGDLPDIECLPSQLNQVFMNLLVNAAHAIEERGSITLRTGCDGDQVWIEITDTGKGIAPEHLKRIFDPFFTTKPVGKGTGLGLSISYNIVKKHHGTIEVESEPGRGTTFRVRLPVTQPEKES